MADKKTTQFDEGIAIADTDWFPVVAGGPLDNKKVSALAVKQYMGGGISSSPTQGAFPVTNLYFDPVTGRMVVEYDDGA